MVTAEEFDPAFFESAQVYRPNKVEPRSFEPSDAYTNIPRHRGMTGKLGRFTTTVDGATYLLASPTERIKNSTLVEDSDLVKKVIEAGKKESIPQIGKGPF